MGYFDSRWAMFWGPTGTSCSQIFLFLIWDWFSGQRTNDIKVWMFEWSCWSQTDSSYFLSLCVLVCACKIECSKARCSMTSSSNRVETLTTYRSNEGGNEKVIFTNFSKLPLPFCVIVCAVCIITGNICRKPAMRWGRENDDKLASHFWCGSKKKGKPARPPCSYCLLLSEFFHIKGFLWFETIKSSVFFYTSTKSVTKQLQLICVSRARLNSWL